MRVFDCFPFFNELDLVEIRIQELWDVVDYFVISEANTSHAGLNKSWNFLDNFERFKDYKDKIRYIQVTNMPVDPNPWVPENHQRRCIARGLNDLMPEDIVIISDCDEIPRGETVQGIKEDTNGYNRYILYTPSFNYKLNFMMVGVNYMVPGPIAVRGNIFRDAQQERLTMLPWNPKTPDTVLVNHGGWHFSYLGNNINVKEKLKNYAHSKDEQTLELIETVDVDSFVNRGVGLRDNEKFVKVKIDNYYPKIILDNLDYFNDLIVKDSTLSVYDVYPDVMFHTSDAMALLDGSFWNLGK